MSTAANSPCAACKFLRRKCTQGCVFAPYFSPDNPGRFAHVHRVFGASNVAKLLNDLTPAQREDAVNSLAYEAEARLHDPVYGCVGYISLLQHRLLQLQRDLSAAKKELSSYIGPSSLESILPQHQINARMYRDHHHQQQQQQQQLLQQQMMISLEQQNEYAVGITAKPSVEGSAFLGFVSPQINRFERSFPVLNQQQVGRFQEEPGHLLHLSHHHHHRRGSDEEGSGVGHP